ncbi:hypothetical protein AB0K00_50130 [Dactylosporangium sp. NPDC049525]|uniref:hypothetical protein n=1 Tax=Dactylosporangium sp. NPDC049525 TaxID=3154730 RepID=UPI0034195981
MRPIGLALLLVMAALTGCSGGTTADPAPAPQTQTPSQAPSQAQTAAVAPPVAGCEFYQAADAKAVLNAVLRPAKLTDNEPGKTDTKFISCVYWTADDQRYANVGYRRALTTAGAADNRSQFKNQRTPDAVAIPGLGSDAYWDTPNGQILVLVGDALLVISTGVRDAPQAGRSRPDTEKLATLVVSHLPG